MRMLMNNLDPEVAERPEYLVVYGGTGKAARSWEAYDAIVRELRRLKGDQTLLVQSGKPVGVFERPIQPFGEPGCDRALARSGHPHHDDCAGHLTGVIVHEDSPPRAA